MSTFPTELNIDIDSLFKMSFNYNFDVLKIAIGGLIRNQRGMYKSIHDLKQKNSNKDTVIKSLIKKLKDDNILKDFDENLLETESHSEESQDQEQVKSNEQGKDPDVMNTFGNNYQDHYEGSSKQFGTDSNKTLTFIDVANDKFNQLIKRTLSNESKLQEITEKLKDINILDIFKGSDKGDEQSDLSTIDLITNLDRKISQKIKNQEERLAKNEEDVFKFKTDLNNIKNAQDSINRTNKNNKEAIDSMTPQIDDMKSSMKILNTQVCADLKKQLEQLSLQLSTKIKEYDSKLDETSLFKPFTPSSTIQEKDDNKTVVNDQQSQPTAHTDVNKQFNELKKHIIEAEKNINKLHPDDLLKDIKAIKEELGQKCSMSRHLDLAAIVDEVLKKIINIKEDMLAHTEDAVGHEDTKLFKKKIEFLMSTLFQIQQSASSTDSNAKNHNLANLGNLMADSTKYLEIAIFNEFKESLREQLTFMKEHISENRKLIDELFTLLKTKASNRDMKEMEEVLMGKLEDLKLACQRKFADKIEMGKNIKFLDAQIKHILEVNVKRTEKGESWILAKKPLGGHNCASCENYIGDLRESNQYIPWNKYPMRDQNEKLYRLGNGFSKMLQMVGSDSTADRKEREQFATSQDFFSSKTFKKDKEKDKFKETDRDREVTSPKREQSLPKLKIKINSSISNLSDNDIVQEQSNFSQEEDNVNNPKM